MGEPTAARDEPLKIVHVLRAPIGGLFRHVLDLSRAQIQRGHRVGLITDSLTGDDAAARILADLQPRLALGLRRTPMRRNPDFSDVAALARTAAWIGEAAADIVHGHGSKGGLFARVPGLWAGPAGPARVYTPHGGSLNHRPGSLASRFYMGVERVLSRRTDLLLFESAYIAQKFEAMVGRPPRHARVVHNGISTDELAPVRPAPDAADFFYVGELRAAKGVDTLIQALAIVGTTLGRPIRACLVGTGPEQSLLQAQADRLGIGDGIIFAGALPARRAFERGKILVLPSRAESLPYIVLEAAGASVPILTTTVGGIPEIFGAYRPRLLPPDDAPMLAARMIDMLSMPEEQRAREAGDLFHIVQTRFSIETMVDSILAAYRDALAARSAARVAPPSPRLIPS